MSKNIDAKQIYDSLLFKKLKSNELSKTPFVDFFNANNIEDIGTVKGMQELFFQTVKNDNDKTCKQAYDEILEILKNDHGLNISV